MNKPSTAEANLSYWVFQFRRSLHGSGLTTSNPDSPYFPIPKMKASMLIAIADNDDQKDPTSKAAERGWARKLELFKKALA
jgi:hypothetical protein